MLRKLTTVFSAIAICLSFMTASSRAQRHDTLRFHHSDQGYASYDSLRVTAVASRFQVKEECSITGLRALVRMKPKGKGRCRIFGSEGWSSAPLEELQIGESVELRGDSSGFQWISVAFEKPIVVTDGQFFVCIDSCIDMQPITDRVQVADTCSCSTETFGSQSLKGRDGKWRNGPYSFAVEPIIEYQDQERPIWEFKTDTAQLPVMNGLRHSLSIGDFSGDGYPDVVFGAAAILGPLVPGKPPLQPICLVDSSSQLNRILVGTIRDEDDVLRVLLLNMGCARESMSLWNKSGIRGMTIEMSDNVLPLYSVAVGGKMHECEKIIVGCRYSKSSSETTNTETPADVLFLLKPSGDRIAVERFELPVGLYSHSATAIDENSDGQLDIVLACTDSVGRAQFVVAELDGSTIQRIKTRSLGPSLVVDAPTISRIGSSISTALHTNVGGHAGITAVSSALDMPQGQYLELSQGDGTLGLDQISSYALPYRGRVSSIMNVELQPHSSAFVVSSGDSCRPLMLLERKIDGTTSRVYNSGIEVLSSCADVGWYDLDGDDDLDAVGHVGLNGLIAWNTSPTLPALKSASSKIPFPPNSDAQIAEVQNGDSRELIIRSTGRGSNVHERIPLLFSHINENDTVILRTVSSTGTVSMTNAQSTRRSDPPMNQDCRIRIVPNPFQTTLNISSEVPITECTVFDASGQTVWHSDFGGSDPGKAVTWDGVDGSGRPVASGTYTVSVTTAKCTVVQRIVRIH